MRWDSAICPLVAGLPREQGEFVLARVSEIARNAGARLGTQTCKPNLYIVATDQADLLVKKWFRRNPAMYNRANGWSRVSRFMHDPNPVRVWYNADFLSSDGTPASQDTLIASLANAGPGALQIPTTYSFHATRLGYSAVQGLSSVIIVVDLKRTHDLNIGQLADYVSLVAMAEIRPDANTEGLPSILGVFHDAGRSTARAAQSLSPWDQAFLRALYQTDQTNDRQAAAIKVRMVSTLTRNSSN